MHNFLSNESLQGFIKSTNISSKRQEEYITLLPKLNERGRILLLETLIDLYAINQEEKRAEKALGFFRDYAKDSDYEKLTKRFEELDKTEE